MRVVSIFVVACVLCSTHASAQQARSQERAKAGQLVRVAVVKQVLEVRAGPGGQGGQGGPGGGQGLGIGGAGPGGGGGEKK